MFSGTSLPPQCLYTLVYLYTCVPVYLYTCVPVYLYTCVPVYLCTCIPVYLCTCVPVYLCTCVPVYLSTCLPVYLYTCIPVYLCTCIPVYLYTCVPVYLYTCVPVYLYTCIPVCSRPHTDTHPLYGVPELLLFQSRYLVVSSEKSFIRVLIEISFHVSGFILINCVGQIEMKSGVIKSR